jgi:zinc/manganese transport system permease protein
MFDPVILKIILPALLIGLLISITHAQLGIKVLEKNIIFIDLAIAHIAALGLIIAKLFLADILFMSQIMASIFALLAAYFFSKIEKIAPDLEEAIIGCSFILSATLTILLLANHPQSGDQVKELLSGQILFVTFEKILFHAPIYLAVIILWSRGDRFRKGMLFYVIFAIAITSSVQLVGIYVVFASLILPAMVARNAGNPFIMATLVGMISVILGMIMAVIFDLPAGILIVVSYFLVGFSIRSKMIISSLIKD